MKSATFKEARQRARGRERVGKTPNAQRPTLNVERRTADMRPTREFLNDLTTGAKVAKIKLWSIAMLARAARRNGFRLRVAVFYAPSKRGAEKRCRLYHAKTWPKEGGLELAIAEITPAMVGALSFINAKGGAR